MIKDFHGSKRKPVLPANYIVWLKNVMKWDPPLTQSAGARQGASALSQTAPLTAGLMRLLVYGLQIRYMKALIITSFFFLIPLSYSLETHRMDVEKNNVFVMSVKDFSSVVRVSNEADGLYVQTLTDPSKGHPDVTYSITKDGAKLIVALETDGKRVFFTDSNGDGIPDERLTVFRENGKTVRILRESIKYTFEEIRRPVESENEAVKTPESDAAK